MRLFIASICAKVVVRWLLGHTSSFCFTSTLLQPSAKAVTGAIYFFCRGLYASPLSFSGKQSNCFFQSGAIWHWRAGHEKGPSTYWIFGFKLASIDWVFVPYLRRNSIWIILQIVVARAHLILHDSLPCLSMKRGGVSDKLRTAKPTSRRVPVIRHVRQSIAWMLRMSAAILSLQLISMTVSKSLGNLLLFSSQNVSISSQYTVSVIVPVIQL